MPNLQLGFIVPSKQHQHSQKSSTWRRFLQRQQPSDLVGGTSSDPQLLLGLQVCPCGCDCCSLPITLVHESWWAWASKAESAALHDALEGWWLFPGAEWRSPTASTALKCLKPTRRCGGVQDGERVPSCPWAFVLRLWSPSLWKRFGDPVAHVSVCSTPLGGWKTQRQGEALGPYIMLLGATLAACTFSFNNMN